MFGPRTLIPASKTDIKGEKIGPKERQLFTRLSKIQKSLTSTLERNLWEASPILKMITSKLNIPDYIKETAWRIYILVAKKRLTQGRSIKGFIAASLYAAIRIHEFPRILDDISDTSLIDRHTIIRSLGIILKDILPDLNLRYRPVTSEQLVYHFGNSLGLPMETQKQAIEMLANASKNGLERNGLDPRGIAGSVIYMASKNDHVKVTQSRISEVAKITEVTLRNRIKQIRSLLKT
ncbi:MAG: transcription initiation factor IIB family protein [Candidatus Thorarchaeota archaeon]